MIDINLRGILVATQAALETPKEWRAHHQHRFVRGRTCMTPAGSLLGHQRCCEAVTQGLSREVGSRDITVNNVQTGPIGHGFESLRGRLGCTAEGHHSTRRYGHVDEVAALVAFVASRRPRTLPGRILTVDGGTNA